MKTTFKNLSMSNAKNLGIEKETIEEYNAVVISRGKIVNPITVRWYMSRSKSAQRVCCSIWVRSEPMFVSGHGADHGGGGYCKLSTAFAEACENAGIETIETGGRGMSVVREALESICEALGYTGKVKVIS